MVRKQIQLMMAMLALAGLAGCAADSAGGDWADGEKSDEECLNDECIGLDPPTDVTHPDWPGNDRVRARSMRSALDRSGLTRAPARLDLVDLQTPVLSQGRRGVCSIFSTAAYMEHLYLKTLQEEGITHWVPDFSEQHLQWAAKFEQGSFTDSSGSNAYYNLQTIQRHGIVAEDAWPYEEHKWTASDLEGCGESEESDRPTACFTNGHPSWCEYPAGKTWESYTTYNDYRSSQPCRSHDYAEYKLPRSGFGDYIATRTEDIKAHMVEHNTGVVVGLDFMYQAWSHGGTQLPGRSDDFRARGIVQMPNQADIDDSGLRRAGHSILLVGYADDMEIQRIDKQGNPMVDANGDAVTEQGFFLFKNSWGTGSWGSKNCLTETGNADGSFTECDPNDILPGYGWISYAYVEAEGRARVARQPVLGEHFVVPTDGPVDPPPVDPPPVDPTGFTPYTVTDQSVARNAEHYWNTAGELCQDADVSVPCAALAELPAGTYEFSMSVASGDPDLHVNVGSQVSASDHTCRPYSGGTRSETCTVELTQPTAVYVMVRGYAASVYSLTAKSL